MRRILAALVLLPGAAAAAATQTVTGSENDLYPLLQKPAGARALAMGGAYEALADDAAGLLWNPAAPGQAQSLSLGMNHEDWFAGTAREVLSVAAPVKPWLGLGAYGALVRYPGLDLRDASGQALGYYTPQEQGFGLSAALVGERLAVGLTARYLHLELPGYSSSDGAGDLGLMWQAAPNLRLATVLKALPQAGGGWSLTGAGGVSLMGAVAGFRWAAATSVKVDPEAASEWDLGGELSFGGATRGALRAGYSQSLPSSSQDLGRRFSVGGGLVLDQYSLDYAFLPWGDFGGTHRLSLSWSQPWSPSQAPPAESAAPAPAPTPTPAPVAAAPVQPMPAAVPVLPAPETRAPEARFRVLSDAVVAARAYAAQGYPQKALALYHRAATENPDDLAAWRGMAELYEQGGRPDYAARCWAQVRRLDPGDPRAAQLR